MPQLVFGQHHFLTDRYKYSVFTPTVFHSPLLQYSIPPYILLSGVSSKEVALHGPYSLSHNTQNEIRDGKEVFISGAIVSLLPKRKREYARI
jgi:hypothetical protein